MFGLALRPLTDDRFTTERVRPAATASRVHSRVATTLTARILRDGRVDLQQGTPRGVDAGVVDEMVQSPVALSDVRERLRAVRRIVGLASHGGGALAQRHDGRVERLLPATGDHHRGTLRDQPAGDAEADAPAAAGDQRHPVGESVHAALLRPDSATLRSSHISLAIHITGG